MSRVGWKILGGIVSFYKGKGISKADVEQNGNTPCIRYGELYTKYTEVISVVESRTNRPIDELFLSRKNDVLIPSSGETKLDIATASCVELDDVALGGDINVLRSDQNGIFLSYYLNATKKYQIAKIAQGDTVVHLYSSQLKGLEVKTPKPKEQQQIADCLSSIDEVIAVQTKKLDALKAHKKGLMQQLFPAEGEDVPKLRFPGFRDAGTWIVDGFDELLDIIDGDRGNYYPKSDEYSSSGYCVFLNAKNVTKNGFKFDEVQFITKEKDVVLRKGKLQRSDVVLTTRGSVGQFALYSEDVPYDNIRINSGMVVLRIKYRKILAEYLYRFCKSDVLASYIENIAFGNAQQQLTVAEIKKFQLFYPQPDEQRKIADCFSSLDDLITTQTQKIEALKAHKKGLMQQLFPAADEAQG